MSEQYLDGDSSMRRSGDADGMGGVGMHNLGSGGSCTSGRRGYQSQSGRPEPSHRSAKAKEGRGLKQVDPGRAGTHGARLTVNEDSSGHRAQEHSGPGQTRGDDRQQGSNSDDVRGGQEGLSNPHGTRDHIRSREQHDGHESQGRNNPGEEERNRMPQKTKRYLGMNHNSPERNGDMRENGEQHSEISGSRGPKIGKNGKKASSKKEESGSEEESSDEESDGSSEEGSDDDSVSEEDSEDDSSEEESEEDTGSEEDDSGEESDEESEEDSDDEED